MEQAWQQDWLASLYVAFYEVKTDELQTCKAASINFLAAAGN